MIILEKYKDYKRLPSEIVDPHGDLSDEYHDMINIRYITRVNNKPSIKEEIDEIIAGKRTTKRVPRDAPPKPSIPEKYWKGKSWAHPSWK